MSLVERLHAAHVHTRRVRVLREHISELLPWYARVLDVGCGDGLLAHLIAKERPDIEIRGIEVLVRSNTHIPVTAFDGKVIPYDDASFDVVMLVDVLHHMNDPMVLLREAARVARLALVIKDHTSDGLFAKPTLRLMDWVGNAHQSVALPYSYWSRRAWLEAFDTLDLRIDVWKTDLALYPRPARWVFDRSLHFITRLDLVPKTSKPHTAGDSRRSGAYPQGDASRIER